jgi:hypothetical protein
MLMLVTVEHCNYLTTNEAYDATFLAAEAQSKCACVCVCVFKYVRV